MPIPVRNSLGLLSLLCLGTTLFVGCYPLSDPSAINNMNSMPNGSDDLKLPLYELIPLSEVGESTQSVPNGLSDRTENDEFPEVVGNSFGATGESRGVEFDVGSTRIRQIQLWTEARSISANGRWRVGEESHPMPNGNIASIGVILGSRRHPFALNIDPPQGYFSSIANCISSTGWVAGTFIGSENTPARAFVYDPTVNQITELNSIFPTWGPSQAFAINNDGFAVGSQGVYGFIQKGYWRMDLQFLDQDNVADSLVGSEDNWRCQSRAVAINDHFDVVGTSECQSPDGILRKYAVHWKPELTTASHLPIRMTAHNLFNLGESGTSVRPWNETGIENQANAINNNRWIVGSATLPRTSPERIKKRAFVWRNESEGMIDLNNITRFPPGFESDVLVEARGINNSNEIIGYAIRLVQKSDGSELTIKYGFLLKKI